MDFKSAEIISIPMTEQHRANPEAWAFVEDCAPQCSYDSCLIELRARVEALEAAAKPAESNYPAKPNSSLVERVAYAIIGDSDGPINWKPEARSAIYEVAVWLREQQELGAQTWAWHLEREAER
jgi:hypothetical protein